MFRHVKDIRMACVALAMLLIPFQVHALTRLELRETTALTLYGIIGFFGGLAFMLFLGGFVQYMVRLGTEHRVQGVRLMAWGVKVLFFVVCALLILVAFVE